MSVTSHFSPCKLLRSIVSYDRHFYNLTSCSLMSGSLLVPAHRDGYNTAASCISPKQSKTKKHTTFCQCQPTKQAAEGDHVSGGALLAYCFTVKSTHILMKGYTWGPMNLSTFLLLERPLGTTQRRCRQSYLPLWGTAASCSWHESCPSSEMLPQPERKKSCCRWDNTCSCLPHCCLPACCPVHTK